MHTDSTAAQVAELAHEYGSIVEACRSVGRRNGSCLGLTVGSDQTSLEARNDTERMVLDLALRNPSWAQIQLANALYRRGVVLAPPRVQGILLRYGLASIKRRYAAVAQHAVELGIAMTPQLVAEMQQKLAASALEREETVRPGELGIQDTYAVGELEGLGAIYQQTFIDVHTGAAFAKLSTQRSPQAAVALLHEQVLPSYEARGLQLERVLTDRGTEYCGFIDTHTYEAFLHRRGIDHFWLQTSNAQANATCQKLHERLHEEFYRRGVLDRDRSLAEIQGDLDAWLRFYNDTRPHRGGVEHRSRPVVEDGSHAVLVA